MTLEVDLTGVSTTDHKNKKNTRKITRAKSHLCCLHTIEVKSAIIRNAVPTVSPKMAGQYLLNTVSTLIG